MSETLLDTAREFIRDVVLPRETVLLRAPWHAAEPVLRNMREEAKAQGLWAPFLAAEHGGRGLSLDEYARLSEVLGWTPFGHYVCNCQAPDVGNMELLHQFGTPEQQSRWFAPLARGEIRSCFAMTEPDNAGSDPTRLSTIAERDGDDYVISGRKWFTSSADGAAFSIVMAITNPDAAPHQRASQIVVPLPSPGFTLVRNISVMGETGGGWASHAEITFDRVRVPMTNRLGEEGAGFALAQERLGPGRIHHCMRWIGICERVFDLMCRRAATREISRGEMLAIATGGAVLDRRFANRDSCSATDGARCCRSHFAGWTAVPLGRRSRTSRFSWRTCCSACSIARCRRTVHSA